MGTQRTLVVATRSEGKLRELLPLLDLCGWRGVTLTQAGIPYVPEEEAIEAFDSFEENALAKARWFLARQQSPGALPVLADDSGLCVDALDGAPGVRSKRWSGSDLAGDPLDAANNAALLRALHNANDRDAHYDLGAGGHGVTTDDHDAFGTSGGIGSTAHGYAGATVQGVSTGFQYKF